MKRIFTALGIFLLSCAARADEARSFILSTDKGIQLLKQCSRDTPQAVKGFFTPDASQVANLEKQLIPYLIQSRPDIALQRYSRQYIGFIKDGKRFIYGNFFKPGPWIKRPDSEAVNVCDGGNSFWGIVYSLESQTFTDLHTNGVA